MKNINECCGFEEKRGNNNLNNTTTVNGICFENSCSENAYSHLDMSLNHYFDCGVHGFEGYRF